MNISENIRAKAKENIKKIVLPEGEESRMIEAAKIIYREKFAKLLFLGKEDKIREVAKKYNVNFPEEIKLSNQKILVIWKAMLKYITA